MIFDASAPEALTATTYVSNTHLMSGLLGPRDEHLRVIERSFPASKIRVRGNEYRGHLLFAGDHQGETGIGRRELAAHDRKHAV